MPEVLAANSAQYLKKGRAYYTRQSNTQQRPKIFLVTPSFVKLGNTHQTNVHLKSVSEFRVQKHETRSNEKDFSSLLFCLVQCHVHLHVHVYEDENRNWGAGAWDLLQYNASDTCTCTCMSCTFCTSYNHNYTALFQVIILSFNTYCFKILKDASRSFIILELFAGNLPTLKRALHFTQIHWYRYNVSVFMTIIRNEVDMERTAV